MAVQGFTGTDRFQLRRRLGAGGMGVVYHVYDVDRQLDVALKLLLRLDADGIYKLKAEFRSLADVSHPNLISLFELVSSDNYWFFTMELIEGVDFLAHVRDLPENEPPDATAETAAEINVFDATMANDTVATDKAAPVVARLRARQTANPDKLRPAMRQLAEGVAAIHAAGKLHRDIKPSNAMVDQQGRVVLLDFGLVSDTSGSHRRRESQHDNVISGTPAYMAPEQAGGGAVTQASDWYAVGVMLYEALAGQLPFTGNWIQLLDAKLSHLPPRPDTVAAGAPVDLSALCMRLLDPKPEKRPAEHEILSLLGAGESVQRDVAPTDDDEPPFLGRIEHLAQLQAALAATGGARPVVVHLRGPAGIGKSTLIRRFSDAQREQPNPPLVLLGRCHERETVPYKAFDSLIDAITRHLLRQGDGELQALLPPDIGGLARIFPVLQRIPAIAHAARHELENLDNRGLRRRAFASLRLLLRRLALRRPIVVVLDDLHWGDADSAELLATLLEAPKAPPILFLLSYRDEEAGSSALLRAFAAANALVSAAVDVRQVTLGPLSRDESLALALELLGRTDALSRRRAEVIVKESAGSPLFVAELVRFRDTTWSSSYNAVTDPEVTLEQVLRARVAHLADQARELLEIVAVAGKPIRQRIVFDAAKLGRDEVVALARLRSGQFVRTTGPADTDAIETFHNRIRETVLGDLAPDRLKGCHARLATALGTPDANGSLDVDALAYHHLRAGHDDLALGYSLQAARRARDVYANHDAIRNYDVALTILGRQDTANRDKLLPEVEAEAAEASRQAGEYAKAADLFQRCLVRAATPDARAQIHVGLGRVYQELGDTQGAIVQLETALRLFGKHPPRNLAELGLQAAGQLLIHFVYSVFPKLAGPRHHDPALQNRADTLFALIRIYYFVDVAKVVWAGVTTINLSRRFSREQDVALAYSFFGVLLFGMGMLKRSGRYCEEALELARRSGDPVAEAVSLLRLGTHAVFCNDVVRGERQLREAVTRFKEVGEMWELQTALMITAVNRFLSSDFRNAEAIFEEMGACGVKLNAIMHQGWALGWAPFCRYLTGQEDAATARASLNRALELSAQVNDIANTSAALMHAANVAVREGQVEEAAGLAIRTYECISRYLVQVPFLQIALVDAAEAAVFALENQARSASPATLHKIARRGIRKALRQGREYPYLVGPALRVQARYVALLKGPAAAEPLFRKAIEVLERTPNRWETGVALADAAKALPDRRDDYRRRARRVFEDIGAVAELRRLDRDPSGVWTLPTHPKPHGT